MVADAAVARWESMVNALTPVLGQRGVAALYRRTLHVAGRTHPCLLQAFEVTEPIGFAPLHKVLLEQPADRAAMATDASIQTFHDLLNSLIGIPLTQKLLGSLWSPTFSGSPVQDSLQ
ncbi:MAG: hypothetical protein K2Q97_12540 [Burkholderiaceae bacterium]|nr:hypothetical protein [Burkholderiaceae bacterium]